jgi:hypothetical protein
MSKKERKIFYVSDLTTAYNEKNKNKLSDFTIRKWVNRLNEIGYVEKQEDKDDKRKHCYIPLVEETEKVENGCILEKQRKILSVIEKGFISWKRIVCEQVGILLKKNYFSESVLSLDDLDKHILLNEKIVISYSEKLFKYIKTPKIDSVSEKRVKNISFSEKKVNSNISDKEINQDESPRKPQACKKCGKIIFKLADLSNIEGDYPYCKSCAEAYLTKKEVEEFR